MTPFDAGVPGETIHGTPTEKRASNLGPTRRQFLRHSAALLAGTALVGKPGLAWAEDPFVQLDALGQAELVRKKQVSARELVEAAIRRIEALNPRINAVVAKQYERALQRAGQPLGDGRFAGVPYLIKDVLEYEGMPNTQGSRLLAKNIGKANPDYIKRSEAAGLIVLGMSNTPEFGLIDATEPLLFGPTRNPWNLEYSTGGSSGGAAAAVAAGLVPIANGTDGGGSIRIPASNCGLFGLKPSRGRMVAMASRPRQRLWDLSVPHALTRSVRDSAALLAETEQVADAAGALPPGGFVAGPDRRRLKIAMTLESYQGQMPHDDVRKAIEGTAKLCADLGHTVEIVKLPFDGKTFWDAFILVWAAEAMGAVEGLSKMAGIEPNDSVFEPWTLGLANFARQRGQEAIQKAVGVLRDTTALMDRFYGEWDVWLTPVLRGPVLRLGEHATTLPFETVMERAVDHVGYTPTQNVAGTPAMSVPLSWDANGLPIGSHFSAGRGREAMLLSLAYELEAAKPWATRRPPVSA